MPEGRELPAVAEILDQLLGPGDGEHGLYPLQR